MIALIITIMVKQYRYPDPDIINIYIIYKATYTYDIYNNIYIYESEFSILILQMSYLFRVESEDTVERMKRDTRKHI